MTRAVFDVSVAIIGALLLTTACSLCDPHPMRNRIEHIDRDLSGVVVIDYCGPAPTIPPTSVLAKHSGTSVTMSVETYLRMTRALDEFDVWSDCVANLAPIKGL